MAKVVEISPAAAAAAAASSTGSLPSVSVIAAGSSGEAMNAGTAVAGQPGAAVSARAVQLEMAAAGGQQGVANGTASWTLSAAVAAVLQQPAPAGAYVVRDIKISRLAGELDSQL
jgi:hypothetical protein